MCSYKLVTCEFKWFGVQNRIESFIQKVSYHSFMFVLSFLIDSLSIADRRSEKYFLIFIDKSFAG